MTNTIWNVAIETSRRCLRYDAFRKKESRRLQGNSTAACGSSFRLRSAPENQPSGEIEFGDMTNHTGLGMHYVNGVPWRSDATCIGSDTRCRKGFGI